MTANGDRSDPHAGIDMGEAALGAALSNESAAVILCDTCETADFFTDTQRTVFRAIVVLSKLGNAIDERVVADYLPAHRDYIMGLPSVPPSVTNVRTYITRLKEHRWHRNLKVAAQKLVGILGNGAQPETLAAWYEEASPLFAGPARMHTAPAAAESVWPQPLGEAAYHGPLGGLVKVWTPECEADPAALLVTLLVGWGSVVGAGPYHTVNADRHRARLFACVVGNSGDSRKGMSHGPVRRALGKVDPEWDANCREGGLSSGEGLISRVRDRTWKAEKGDPSKHRIADPGVTDKRLFLREEEFARVTTVMSRDKNTLSQIIRNLWDTGDASVLTKGPHDKTTGAHVCLIGNITQSELRRALTDCDAENGFANRFLWVCAKRSRSLPRGGNVDLPASRPFIEALQEAYGFIHAGEFDGEIPWSKEAGELWDATYEGLFALGDGLTAAILARSHAQVLRLALTYALADGSHAIELVHLEAALEVWRYCAASVRYIFGDRTGDATADRILEALRRGDLSRTQILRTLRPPQEQGRARRGARHPRRGRPGPQRQAGRGKPPCRDLAGRSAAKGPFR